MKNTQFKRFDKVIISNPSNITGTYSGMVLEVQDDDTYLVGFMYQGIQTSTEVHVSQLTGFAEDNFVVVFSSN